MSAAFAATRARFGAVQGAFFTGGAFDRRAAPAQDRRGPARRPRSGGAGTPRRCSPPWTRRPSRPPSSCCSSTTTAVTGSLGQLDIAAAGVLPGRPGGAAGGGRPAVHRRRALGPLPVGRLAGGGAAGGAPGPRPRRSQAELAANAVPEERSGEALRRLLAAPLPRVVVATRDLPALIAETDSVTADTLLAQMAAGAPGREGAAPGRARRPPTTPPQRRAGGAARRHLAGPLRHRADRPRRQLPRAGRPLPAGDPDGHPDPRRARRRAAGDRAVRVAHRRRAGAGGAAGRAARRTPADLEALLALVEGLSPEEAAERLAEMGVSWGRPMSVADRLSALSPEQRALFETLRAAAGAAARRALPPPVRPVSGPSGGRRLAALVRPGAALAAPPGEPGAGLLERRRRQPRAGRARRRRPSSPPSTSWSAATPPGAPPSPSSTAGRCSGSTQFLAAGGLADRPSAPCRRELRERGRPRGRSTTTRATRSTSSAAPCCAWPWSGSAAREHLYLLTIHHLATDWITFQIFFAELMAVYEALRAGRPPPCRAPALQFPDYVRLGAGVAARARCWRRTARFWRRELAGFPLALDLPADRPRPAVQSQRGGLFPVAPGPSGGAAAGAGPPRGGDHLHGVAGGARRPDRPAHRPGEARRRLQQRQPRPAGAASRWPASSSPRSPSPSTWRAIPTFRELLARARRTALSAYAHQNLPFSKLIEALGVEPGPGALSDRPGAAAGPGGREPRRVRASSTSRPSGCTTATPAGT